MSALGWVQSLMLASGRAMASEVQLLELDISILASKGPAEAKQVQDH